MPPEATEGAKLEEKSGKDRKWELEVNVQVAAAAGFVEFLGCQPWPGR